VKDGIFKMFLELPFLYLYIISNIALVWSFLHFLSFTFSEYKNTENYGFIQINTILLIYFVSAVVFVVLTAWYIYLIGPMTAVLDVVILIGSWVIYVFVKIFWYIVLLYKNIKYVFYN
jgi:hypothetical protein